MHAGVRRVRDDSDSVDSVSHVEGSACMQACVQCQFTTRTDACRRVVCQDALCACTELMHAEESAALCAVNQGLSTKGRSTLQHKSLTSIVCQDPTLNMRAKP